MCAVCDRDNRRYWPTHDPAVEPTISRQLAVRTVRSLRGSMRSCARRGPPSASSCSVLPAKASPGSSARDMVQEVDRRRSARIPRDCLQRPGREDHRSSNRGKTCPDLAPFPPPVDLMVDLRKHRIYEWLLLGWSGRGCDSRCLAFRPSFWRQNLSGLESQHERGHFYIEGALYDRAVDLRGRPGVHLRFPIEPDYRGLAGHWDKNYDSPRERLKFHVRALLRAIIPKLWI